eukprot:764711-Pyramimonas_sp.AAC.1
MWRPAWSWGPESPNPLDPARQRAFIPAFNAHPSMAQGQRPAPAPMDPPLYPDGSRAPNRFVRETAD